MQFCNGFTWLYETWLQTENVYGYAVEEGNDNSAQLRAFHASFDQGGDVEQTFDFFHIIKTSFRAWMGRHK